LSDTVRLVTVHWGVVGMRGPRAAVVVTENELAERIRLTKRTRVNRAVAFRARLVLAGADQPLNTVVARRCDTATATVGRWRQRFLGSRRDGLYDESRVGAPCGISDGAVEAVIVKTLETLPVGETPWCTRTMAANAGMSHTMVGRAWRTLGLKHHATKSFRLSPDSQLVEKVRDVVRLSVAPPRNPWASRSMRSRRFKRSRGPNRSCRWNRTARTANA
jgi:hypothetical protein